MMKNKLPFVSKKEYNRVKKNYEVEAEARRKIRKAFIDYQMETIDKDNRRNEAYSQMEDNCKQLCNRLEFMECEMGDLKKEIKRLKTLCTKNGIEYKKGENEK